MKLNNRLLRQTIRELEVGIINQDRFLQKLDTIYKANPTSFTEEEVDYIEKQFKKTGVDFNRDLKVADANLISTANQFVSGLVEGFTTLGWSDEPDTSIESIANKVGHLVGFAPDVIASALSMGQYIPVAVAKRASLKAAGGVTKGLRAAGEAAPPAFRKEIGTDTFALQSIPMKVADKVIEQAKASFGDAGILKDGFLAKGILKSSRFRDIGEQAAHLGIAMGVSSWTQGAKGAADAAIHGAIAGGMFGTIGNYVNVARIYANPKTRKLGENIIRRKADELAAEDRTLEGINMAIKGAIGSGLQGGMATAQNLPVPEQVYEYLLGAFFGATARDAGFIQRIKYLNKNSERFRSLEKTEQTLTRELEADPEFLALPKFDRDYVKSRIPLIQQQVFERDVSITKVVIPEVKAILDEKGITRPTREQWEQIKAEVEQTKIAEALESVENIAVISDKDKSGLEAFKREIKENLGMDLADLVNLTSKDLNEPAISNPQIKSLVEKLRSYNISTGQDQLLVDIGRLAVETEYNLPKFKEALKEKYPEQIKDGKVFFKDVNESLLGSYLKLKKNVQIREDYEIDFSSGQPVVTRQPIKDIGDKPVGAPRQKSKYNEHIADGRRVRIIVRQAYIQEKLHKFGLLIKDGGLVEVPIFGRKKILDFSDNDITIGSGKNKKVLYEKFEYFLKDSMLNDLNLSAREQGYYIYGGAKDTGEIILHKRPFTDTEITTTLQKQLLKDNKLFTQDKLTDVQAEDYASNIYYSLLDAGYIKANEPITYKKLNDGLKKFRQNPLFETVQKFNKYNSLAQGQEVKLESVDYKGKLDDNGEWRVVQIEDLPSTFKIDGEPSKSAIDAVVYIRKEVFDAISDANYRDPDSGFLKLVGFKAPREGTGTILFKTGTFRATTAMDKFMKANNIDIITAESATKTMLGIKKHKLDWNNNTKEYSIKDNIESFGIKPEELYLNYGVYENPNKLYHGLLIAKQMFDKLNKEQIGKDYDNFVADYDRMIESSVVGDPKKTKAFEEAFAKQDLSVEYSIDTISLGSINRVLESDQIKTPFGLKLLRKILERGREDYHQNIQEATDLIDVSLQQLVKYDVPDALFKTGYDIGSVIYPPYLSFINRSLTEYRHRRVVKPRVGNSVEGKLGPADLETASGLRDNQIKLGETFRDMPIMVGADQISLGKAVDRLNVIKNDIQQFGTEINQLRDALTFLIMRNPNSGNGGVRVVEVVGFTGRRGMNVVTTSKTDYYLGGADKDADSVFMYQNMPESFKTVFKKYENELAGKNNEDALSFETPQGKEWQSLVEQYPDIKVSEGGANGTRALEDLMNSNLRIDVARNARIGKKNIEYIVSGFNRMQMVADIIQQDTAMGIPEMKLTTFIDGTMFPIGLKLKTSVRELQLDTYRGINLMADSANFTKVATYDKILDTFWSKHFEITGKPEIVVEKGLEKQVKTSDIFDRYSNEYEYAFNRITELKSFKDIHSVGYRNKNVTDPTISTTIGENYLKTFGSQNRFYYHIAKSLVDYPNFVINPFKFYAKEFKDFASTDVAKALILRYRELVVDHPLLQRFGLTDNYNSQLEAKDTLNLIINEPGLLHQKVFEYQGIFRSLKMSEQFIRDIQQKKPNEYGSETAEMIVKDIIDQTFMIKSLFDRGNNLSFPGKRHLELSGNDVNTLIRRVKLNFKDKYPAIYKDIEPIIETWLLSSPLKGPTTDIQKLALLDIEKENSNISKFIKNGDRLNNEDYSRALYFKNLALTKYRPNVDNISSYISISNKGRQSFFSDMRQMLESNGQRVGEKLAQKLIDNDAIKFEEQFKTTFSIEAFDKSLSENTVYQNNFEIVEDRVKFNFFGNKDKIVDTVIDDAPNLKTKQENLDGYIGELIPQFEYLFRVESDKNAILTDRASKEIKKLRETLYQNPDTIMRLEEMFMELTYNQTGVQRRLETMTTEDLVMFNQSLEMLLSKKTAFQKQREAVRKPSAIDQTLGYGQAAKYLFNLDRMEIETNARPTLDKNGEISKKRISIPVTTLEAGRVAIDKFDTYQKIIYKLQQDKVDGVYYYFNTTDKLMAEHRDLLFQAAVNKIEYNPGPDGKPRFPTQVGGEGERTYIVDSYLDTQSAIKKLEDSGVVFNIPQGNIDGTLTPIKPQQFVDRIASDTSQLLQSIKNTYIKTNVQQLSKTLVDLQKVKGLSYGTNKDGAFVVEGVFKGSQTKDLDSRNLEQTFLLETGIINEKRVSLLYKDMMNRNVTDREYIGKYLMSVNDYRFIKYHMELRDRIQFMLQPKGIDVSKPKGKVSQKGSEAYIVKETVLRELAKTKGEYSKYYVGDIVEGYFPRLGHGRYTANQEKLAEWIKDNVEVKFNRALEDKKLLPAYLQAKMDIDGVSHMDAALTYKRDLQAGFERMIGVSITNGQASAERQITDLMERPNLDGFIGDYAASMTKNRGETFMPFYQKDIDAVRFYTSGLFKMWFTNLAGLRSEILLRNFDKVHKGQEWAADWSNYMRDSFTNMMGLSTYRALNLHGIQKKDQEFLRQYIKDGLTGPKEGTGRYKKDLIKDFDAAIDVMPHEQMLIFKRNNRNVKKTKAEIKALRLSRANKLVERVNSTGKYGSLYHLTSDEVAVRFFNKLDRAFGGKLFGPLPTNSKDRQFAIMQRVRQLSDLEGKFELLSLLSHPKTAITNLYGGTVNTISDTGWSAFRKANDSEWMIQNLFGGGKAEFSVVGPDGRVQKVQINSMKRIYEWMETIGVYDQMFLDLVSLDKNFGRQGVKKFWIEFISRMNKSYKEGRITSKELHDIESKRTLRETAEYLKVEIPVVEAGALPMKWSERRLRGTAFLANYINMRTILGEKIFDGIPFNSPVITDFAMKGVKASQFMYQATFRPNFANTSLGRVLTRFQPYAWNSIGRRIQITKDAKLEGWKRDTLSQKKFERQLTLDLMALALGNIFIASIFEYALSPPMNWLQDTSALLFGDEKERERAFFSSYPSQYLAPLQIVTPPIARFVLSPVTAILNGDMENFYKYQVATYFPFGRLFRDLKKTYDSPAMAVDFMTGLPLRRLHSIRRDQMEQQAAIEEELDTIPED